MARKPSPDRPAHGTHKAATLAPDRVQKALAEFKGLNTRESRAAFADYWIGMWAQDFEYAWWMVYELLNIVEEDRLYEDPTRVGPGAPGDAAMHGDKESYSTFAEFFEDRVKQPFSTWAQMEETYHYAEQYAPELFTGTYSTARERAQAEAETAPPSNKINPWESGGQLANCDIISVRSGTSGGTDPGYLARRIARDHPDILARMKAGEFRSVHAAALEAGIKQPSIMIRLRDPASAARTLRKHMKPSDLAELIRLLTEEGER